MTGPDREPQALAWPAPTPAELLARVVHREAGFLVVDKPPGLVSAGPPHQLHGEPHPRQSVESLLVTALSRPVWAVHQLDRLTSGLNVFALKASQVAPLAERLKSPGAKRYLAIVHGHVAASVPFTIDAPLTLALDPLTGKTQPAIAASSSGGNVGSRPRSVAAGAVGPVEHGPEVPAETGAGASDPITSHAVPSPMWCGKRIATSGGNVGSRPRSVAAGAVGPVEHGPEVPAETGAGPSDTADGPMGVSILRGGRSPMGSPAPSLSKSKTSAPPRRSTESLEARASRRPSKQPDDARPTDPRAREARTHVVAVTHNLDPSGALGPFSLVELHLETGRQHQVRLHLAHIGHPLVGESLHRRPPCTLHPRHALHAYRLVLPATKDHPALELRAPLPADLRDLLARLGFSDPTAAPGA